MSAAKFSKKNIRQRANLLDVQEYVQLKKLSDQPREQVSVQSKAKVPTPTPPPASHFITGGGRKKKKKSNQNSPIINKNSKQVCGPLSSSSPFKNFEWPAKSFFTLSPQIAPPNREVSPYFPCPENDNLEYVIKEDNASYYAEHLVKLIPLFRPDCYHRFIVESPCYDKTTIINSLLNQRHVPTLDVFPLYFHMYDGIFSFLANQCSPLIQVLCNRGMYVAPGITFQVRLNAVKLDLKHLFKEIALRRLDKQNKNLDLSSLHNIPELEEIAPEPATNIEVLWKLLFESLLEAPQIVSICLADNSLTTVSAIQKAYVYYCDIGHRDKKPPYFSVDSSPLRILDLSYNKFDSWRVLGMLRDFPITELHMHHNPCCNVHGVELYVSFVKNKMPRLVKLDGIYIPLSGSLPPCLPNFIVGTKQRADQCQLADQFLDHFFSLYDEPQRSSLAGVYHQKACFSLCAMYLPELCTSDNAHLEEYSTVSRNLLEVSDISEVYNGLWHTPDEILPILQLLPRTEHDPYTFTVDVVNHTYKRTILAVTGVFRELETFYSNGVETTRVRDVSLRHFMRTFVLINVYKNEYKILNDILYISNATSLQTEEAFCFVHPKTQKKEVDKRPPSPTSAEKLSMLEKFEALTETRTHWANKYLEDANWDLAEALTVFTELLKLEKIPAEAFLEKCKFMPSI